MSIGMSGYLMGPRFVALRLLCTYAAKKKNTLYASHLGWQKGKGEGDQSRKAWKCDIRRNFVGNFMRNKAWNKFVVHAIWQEIFISGLISHVISYEISANIALPSFPSQSHRYISKFRKQFEPLIGSLSSEWWYSFFVLSSLVNIYLSTDYFGTRQIIFGNNMNTIEMHLTWDI